MRRPSDPVQLTINFIGRFRKMPQYVEHLDTYIKDVSVIEFRDLTIEEVERDTAMCNGMYYTLPQTTLIKIALWSVTIYGGQEWTTYRRYTPEKLSKYNDYRGQQVQIRIGPYDRRQSRLQPVSPAN